MTPSVWHPANVLTKTGGRVLNQTCHAKVVSRCLSKPPYLLHCARALCGKDLELVTELITVILLPSKSGFRACQDSNLESSDP